MAKKVRFLSFSWLSGFIRSWREYSRFKKLPSEQKSIVFYSESKQDWHHFEPYITYLCNELTRSICYVTSGKDDLGLTQKNNRLASFYLQEGFWQILFFQMLNVDILVLTMIDLNIFQLKRSINPVHYIYIFHAMGSTHMVDFDNSYDHYDTIFCVGPHHIKEIRKREELKKLPPKHLFKHGYSRIDTLTEKSNSNKEILQNFKDPKTILLAPTWGDNSILPLCGDRLISILLDYGYGVILRPHYQTIRLTPKIVDTILKHFNHHPRFSYIDLMGDTESLFSSDILICDWSSMSIEYSLGLKKPVLYIDVPKRIRNVHYTELKIEPMEIVIRKEIGSILPFDTLEKAPEYIEALLLHPDKYHKKIDMLKKKWLFNPGNSIKVGSLEIARLADEKKQKK